MRRSRRCRDGQSSAILRGEEEGVEAKDEHRVSHFLAVGCGMWDVLLQCGKSGRRAVPPATKCKEDTVLSTS